MRRVGRRTPSLRMVPISSARAAGRSPELPIAVASDGAFIELFQAFISEFFGDFSGDFIGGLLGGFQMRAYEAVEALLAGLWQQVAVHRGETDGCRVHTVKEGFEAGLGVLFLVLL